MPLHPDLSLLRSSDLGSRITWVQTNWLVDPSPSFIVTPLTVFHMLSLEGLPFPNEEFDFV